MANLRANKIVSTTGSNAITGSVEFDGNDYLLESTGADGFNGGLGDWTVEAWMYCTDASQPDMLVNGLTSTTDRFYIQFIGQTIYIGDGISNIIAIGGVKQVNSWFHIAVTKSSSTYRAFINGILIGSSTSALVNSPLTSLQIGYRGSQNYYTKGFISNLRVIKGTALYTDNFIPPTAELKNVPGTVLLCCQNPSSATQEATGKTITVNGNATARNFAPAVGFDGYVEFLGSTKISTENYFYLPTGNTEDRGRGRGLFGGGGSSPSLINTIDYIQIQSQGNATDFGDLIQQRRMPASCSSSTRGLWGGGYTPTQVNTIDYVTISTTSNAQDFGDLTNPRLGVSACSSSTRGLFGGGYASNVIDYVTIATTGNAIDFGDIVNVFGNQLASCSSPTRGIFAGGTGPTVTNVIEYVTILSSGNALDFGDLTVGRASLSGCSSSTRGIFAGGTVPSPLGNVIDYITISSLGNANDFGDLTVARRNIASTSSSTRGVFGGSDNPSTNTIDFIIISTTGNANDFGDLTMTKGGAGCSDSHGGLG